jgi:putative glutamine amidotransferase
MSERILLAVSKLQPNYDKWIEHHDSSIEIVDCYEMPYDEVKKLLTTCSGVLITGGNDINPALYHLPDEVSRCGALDNRRDTLEQMMIREAIRNKTPLLGICRGEQMLNVTLGGTLVVDIPADIENPLCHRGEKKGVDALHRIRINKDSVLFKIFKSEEVEINSSHHQSVAVLGKDVVVGATADDGVIEAIELKNSEGFVLGVQWHPERMDYFSPASGNIADHFIREIKNYAQKR